MTLRVWMAAAAFAMIAAAQPPVFRVEDVRPHGAEEPHPLVPGMLAWIFGSHLANPPGCGVQNLMDPGTYKTDLCGTRVLVDGIEAKLIFVSDAQINLVLPQGPWENRMVDFQVIRDGSASTPIPVRFGFNHPVLSLASPAYTGMPVWIHVEKPWGTGWIRYPGRPEPWSSGMGCFEMRFENQDLKPLFPGCFGWGMQVGLPHEPPEEFLNRFPLHLLFRLDRPGRYQVRYYEPRNGPKGSASPPMQVSEWTDFTIMPSTALQRAQWFRKLTANAPSDPVDLLVDYLPSLLAGRDEATLRILVPHLKSKDALVHRYAINALQYFDPSLVKRYVPQLDPSGLIAP